MRRLVLFGSLAVAVAACSGGPQPGAPRTVAPPAASAAPAPWTEGERARLASALRAAFAPLPAEAAGIAVLAADGSRLFGNRADIAYTPASTLKLLVAATSLDAFGPAHRFETSFVALAPPDAGVLSGPLWLVGGGDPVLTSADVNAGVGALARGGLRRVAGDLVVDATLFAGPEQNPNWSADDVGQDYASGTSAVSLDWNVVQFRVTPSEPGVPASIAVEPRNRNVAFGGLVTTGYGGDVRIDRVGRADGNAFAVSGRVAPGPPFSLYVPAASIPLFAGGAVASMLQQRGIAFDGTVREGGSPLGGATLWLHDSPPLGRLLKQMLVHSDNHIAEQLLRSVGTTGGRAGSDAAGLRAERAWLGRNAIPDAGMRVYDGSGLSPRDALPPAVLAAVVDRALRSPHAQTYLDALPRVGMEGTVRYHNLHAALGRARAKSGHIAEVNGLAGTVLTRSHGRVSFAFIVNGPWAGAGELTQAQDRALDALAEF